MNEEQSILYGVWRTDSAPEWALARLGRHRGDKIFYAHQTTLESAKVAKLMTAIMPYFYRLGLPSGGSYVIFSKSPFHWNEEREVS